MIDTVDAIWTSLTNIPIIFTGQPRNSKWDRFRDKLVQAHPYCSVCNTKENLQAHHKKPYHLFRELELVESNIVILCIRCHLLFGHLLDWTAWNPNIDEDIERWHVKIVNRLYDRVAYEN